MAGFKKAVRENIYTKVLAIAPSGGGKTYSMLRMASGLAKKLSVDTGEEHRIAFIETESRRSTYYADEFDYDILEIKAPFEPEKFVDAIDLALDEGYKVIVVDSLTHEWQGKGGVLEIHSKMSGNSYTNWAKITPRHDKFVDKILDSPAYIFATVRGKDKYVLEDQNGKQVPRKVGLGYQQRDDLEFLFTVAMTIEQDTHLMTTVKDNTHLFENRNDILNEKDGELLYAWASGGDVKAKKAELDKAKEEAKARIKLNEEKEAKKIAEETEIKKTKQKDKVKSVDEVKKEIIALCKSKSGSGKRAEVSDLLTQVAGSPNPNDIDDIETANEVLSLLEQL